MKTKYFNIFVHYDAIKAGTFDIEEILDYYEYESFEEFLEEEGESEILNDGDWYLTRINSVYVAESSKKHERLFGNPELNDGETYEDEEYSYEECEYEIPKEGYAFIQKNNNLMNAFVVKANTSEEFDIYELSVTNAGNTLIYKGKEYNVAASDGDDNGNVTFYLNGEELSN